MTTERSATRLLERYCDAVLSEGLQHLVCLNVREKLRMRAIIRERKRLEKVIIEKMESVK